MSENERQLIQSSRDGDDAKVKALIDQGVDVNALVVRTIALFILRLHWPRYCMTPLTLLSQGDNTPLLEAAWKGKTSTIKLLVAKGAVIDKANSVRRNPNRPLISLWIFLHIFWLFFPLKNLLNRSRGLSVIGYRFDFKIAFILFEKIKDISRRN